MQRSDDESAPAPPAPDAGAESVMDVLREKHAELLANSEPLDDLSRKVMSENLGKLYLDVPDAGAISEKGGKLIDDAIHEAENNTRAGKQDVFDYAMLLQYVRDLERAAAALAKLEAHVLAHSQIRPWVRLRKYGAWWQVISYSPPVLPGTMTVGERDIVHESTSSLLSAIEAIKP